MRSYELLSPEDNLALHNCGDSFAAFENAYRGVQLTEDLVLRKKFADQALVFGISAAYEQSFITALPIILAVARVAQAEFPIGASEQEARIKAGEWEGVYGELDSQAAAVQNLLPLYLIAQELTKSPEFSAAYQGLMQALERNYEGNGDRFAMIFRMRYGSNEDAFAALEEYEEEYLTDSPDGDIAQYTTLVSLILGRAFDTKNVKEFSKGISRIKRILASGLVSKSFLAKELKKNFSKIGKKWKRSKKHAQWSKRYESDRAAFDLSDLEALLDYDHVAFEG